ncbi:MAG TPA: 3-deoxy-manno-octulosonate cytidylyltransferase [Thermoanaerobaculia bacterium]|nr:3-deoxy-manno-octulosonate cytidylyltransferase [Thermoanaerobaculia bacterium]
MTAAILIPARYGSTRFPGKPLALISGVTLIERVYRRATLSTRALAVFVATDDERIDAHVQSFGGRSVVTEGTFDTGTDRIAAALATIEKDGERFDYVVNLQGDEPLIDISSVDRLIDALESGDDPIVTLACPIETESEFNSPDVVKVVTDLTGRALYFSRSPVPHSGSSSARRHVGIYGFQRDALLSITRLPQSDLERLERLEQLRALENGYKIRVLYTAAPHLGVDRFEDIRRVEDELARSQPVPES